MINIKDEIYSKFKLKFEQITKDSFDNFFDVIYSELEITENKNSSINYLLARTIRPTKKRWVKIIMNDLNSSFNKEIQSARIQYDKVTNGEIPSSKFESYFGVPEIGAYKKNKIKELNKWIKEDNFLLSDFKYLEDMKLKSILAAFKYDIYLLYLINYEKNEEYIEKNNITKVPTILSEIPIDITGKIDYLSDAQKYDLTEDSHLDAIPTIEKLISLEGEEKEAIIMKLEKKTYLEIKNGGNPDKFLDMMAQIAVLKSIKYLNTFDTKIINYYYNHFENALTDTPIDKTLYEINKDLELPNTPSYYENIENSLAKIGSINLAYTLEENRLYGNLLTCMIYNDNGIKKAKVYLGTLLKELAIKDSAFEYDKEVYNNLSAPAQQLAVWLQKRRFRLAINKKGNLDGIAIKSFSNAIYFSTKRADRRKKKVLELIEELKNNELIVEDYNYNKKIDNVIMEYMDLTVKERKKLGLLNNDIVDNVNAIDVEAKLDKICE
ncbi:hypothetical protein [uncultured Clostridium sp.]|uniref:hypothetical protein n=1 Tax=uncultured Clostridium sp. TaxID=59620 RepID=UPI0028EAA6C9|nr:hypothetical protein [uncultured Clostridium sp.]